MTAPEEAAAIDGIAIIGMSGRFPGARDLAEFWSSLRNGVEAISFFPDRPGSDRAGEASNWVNAAGVLEGIELFDAAFFGFNPLEAATLDPQQRLLLECAWHAMEDAGYDPETCRGPVGVYAGCAMSTYLFNLLGNPEHRKRAGDFSVFTGNDKDFLTTRVSYKLNLRGPSVAVQTACSTSLVAVAMACDSLMAHQCDMALAGGVAIRVPQDVGYAYQEGQIFSRDGHTRSFDAEASGTVFTNGVGLVVLKRLEDALADGDSIRAVIKGAAINNDGSLKVGYAAPSLDAQAEVVAMAHALSGVDARSIGYVEAHGTATPMGDAIEIAALTRAFRVSTGDKAFCAVGSVKSNVGHLDTASGVAALIKTALALQHGAILPTIHYQRPNPAIDFEESPFYVNNKLREWLVNGSPRRAGVHSFGIGGTNAHVVLEEAPASESTPSLRSQQLLVLSARSKSALQAAGANLASHLHRETNPNLADAAFSLQVGRREFAQRQVIVCKNRVDAIGALQAVNNLRAFTGTKSSEESSVAFLFPGIGNEYAGMADELYRSEPTFRRHVDYCAGRLISSIGVDLRHVLFPVAIEAANHEHGGIPAAYAELSLFVVEYALAQLWMEWGVKPEALLGQGVGEYAAACVAEIFPLETALLLLAASLRANGASATAFVQPDLSVIEKTDSLQPPKIPCISSVTGTWITATAATDPRYRGSGPRGGDRFAEGMACLLGASNRIVVEVGPRKLEPEGVAQNRAVEEGSVKFGEESILSSLGSQDESISDTESMLNALGQLWLRGVKPDWAGFWRHEKRRRIPLPGYVFDRKRYWVEPEGGRAEPLSSAAAGQVPALPPEAPLADSEVPAVPATAVDSDEVERGVAEIWRRLLGVERVGSYDNFFALGGHSMLGAQLLASLREAFHVEIPLPNLFEAPTVAGMAERIRALR